MHPPSVAGLLRRTGLRIDLESKCVTSTEAAPSHVISTGAKRSGEIYYNSAPQAFYFVLIRTTIFQLLVFYARFSKLNIVTICFT